MSTIWNTWRLAGCTLWEWTRGWSSSTAAPAISPFTLRRWNGSTLTEKCTASRWFAWKRGSYGRTVLLIALRLPTAAPFALPNYHEHELELRKDVGGRSTWWTWCLANPRGMQMMARKIMASGVADWNYIAAFRFLVSYSSTFGLYKTSFCFHHVLPLKTW